MNVIICTTADNERSKIQITSQCGTNMQPTLHDTHGGSIKCKIREPPEGTVTLLVVTSFSII